MAKALWNFLRFVSIMLGSACLLAAAPAPAQTAASARAFINSVLRLLPSHGIPYSPSYYHSSLLALIHADLKAAEAAHGIPDSIDAEIICNCQEWDGIWLRKIDANLVKPGQAVVTASFDIRAPKDRASIDLRVMRYTLVVEDGQWRIYDIQDLSPWETGDDAHVPLREGIQNDLDDLKNQPQ